MTVYIMALSGGLSSTVRLSLQNACWDCTDVMIVLYVSCLHRLVYNTINKRANIYLAVTFAHVWNDTRMALTTDLKFPVPPFIHYVCKRVGTEKGVHFTE